MLMTILLWSWLALYRQGLNVPNAFRVLIDTPVTGEEAHSRYCSNALGRPLFHVLVAFVDEILCLDVGTEVIGDKVVVAVIDDTVN